jgi:probable phosphoglycerate mutase
MLPAMPSPTVVLLVRHGKTPTTGARLPGRAPGLHLAEEGRRQAEAVARRLAGLRRLAAVYASPLERARETAAAIASAHGLAVRVDRDLADCDTGAWTGRPLGALRRRREWATVQRQPSAFRFPDGESFVEMLARMVGALARMVERHRGRTVVAVSHADPIKAALANVLGLHLDLFQRIVVAPASVSAIAYGREGATVLAVNALAADVAGLGPS